MGKPDPQTTPAARKLVAKLAEQKLMKFDPSASYTFKHYSFSRNQKSMGAWAWELLKNGVSTNLGSAWGVRELLKQGKLSIGVHGNIDPSMFSGPSPYSETGNVGGLR